MGAKPWTLDSLILDSEGAGGFPVCGGFLYTLFREASRHRVTGRVVPSQQSLALAGTDQEKGDMVGERRMAEPLHAL